MFLTPNNAKRAVGKRETKNKVYLWRNGRKENKGLASINRRMVNPGVFNTGKDLIIIAREREKDHSSVCLLSLWIK